MVITTGCWLVQNDETSCFDTFDLSESGVAILTTSPLQVGRIVSLQFFTPLAASPLTISAEVVWSLLEPEAGMGLRFLDMDEKTAGIIREFARELKKRPQQ
jgi:hypothetical protein